jgi:glutamyl-tRNA synthetase
VLSGPASFDPVKLDWLAGEYMKQLPLEQKVVGCEPYLIRAKLIADPISKSDRDRLKQIVAACGDRIKVFSDILSHAPVFFRRDPLYDPKSVEKRLKRLGAADLLRAFTEVLKSISLFDAPTLEAALQSFCVERSMKPAELVHPLRVAVTGVEVGIGLFETLAILGQAEALRRIEMASQLVHPVSSTS